METSVIRSESDQSLMNNLVCYGCNIPIIDRCLSKVLDKLWHDQCVRCSQCHIVLRDKCFTRDSNLYCKTDYDKLYGVQCSGCDEGILPNDLVRRVDEKFFHLTCLKCVRCGQEVSTGDQLYKLKDGTFLCKSDYENQLNINNTNGNGIISNSNGNNKTPLTQPVMKSKQPSPLLQKIDQDSEPDDEPPATPMPAFTNGDNPMSDDDDEPNRRRGPRTTIKAKQLEVLKAAFIATPKPSRHIREKLAADTGLTMRVIQVWFQNRRSKERRVKQLSVHDPRRSGFRKNGASKEPTEVTYPFFQNASFPQPIDEHFNQAGFRFDVFSRTGNLNEANGNNTNSKSNDINNNGNGNTLPLTLPLDASILRMPQREGCKEMV